MSSVLVLTAANDYWAEVSVKKALKWAVAGKINILEQDDSQEVGSMTFKIKLPLIVQLLEWMGYKPKREEVSFSANAVYQRDRNFCQYWHKDENGKRFKHRCTVDDRTIDHIMPVSRGGKGGFLNCVCACRHCNERIKKNRTPKEAGLVLIQEPKVPKRSRDDWVRITFPFRPGKKTHTIYLEKYLGGMIRY